MIVYYTPPAIITTTNHGNSTAFLQLPLPIQPGGPMIPVPAAKKAVKVPYRQQRINPAALPNPSWIRNVGFPFGVLVSSQNWQAKTWVNAGHDPLYKAVRIATGMPVYVDTGTDGSLPVQWNAGSRYNILYSVAHQAGVIIEILPHEARIVSG